MWSCHPSMQTFSEMHVVIWFKVINLLKFLAGHLASVSRPLKTGPYSITLIPRPSFSENTDLQSHSTLGLQINYQCCLRYFTTSVLLLHSEKLFNSSVGHKKIGKSPGRLTEDHFLRHITPQILHLTCNFRRCPVLDSPSYFPRFHLEMEAQVLRVLILTTNSPRQDERAFINFQKGTLSLGLISSYLCDTNKPTPLLKM